MKNYAICYSSRTGNTEKVALAIQCALGEKNCIVSSLPEAADVHAAEIVFVGFWTDRGDCSDEVKWLLQQLDHKKIALFGTAGFGMQQSYFQTVLNKVKQALPETCSYMGGWMCQGKMPVSVKENYEKALCADPDNFHIKMYLENFAHTSTHPDERDLEAAAAFAKEIMKKNETGA